MWDAIYEVEEGVTYFSRNGYPCKVLMLAQHAQDCSIGMVVYTNLEPTFDSPAGKKWIMTESLFMTRFKTK